MNDVVRSTDECDGHTKLFRVTRTFVTVIAAKKPFQALEMVRDHPEAWDTDIFEHVELVEETSP